jgi:hypothetical protein
MPDGAVVFGRERGCTDFDKVFGRVSCWEIRRQGAPQDEGHGEEEQQAEDYEPENEGIEDQHRKGPCGLWLLQAVIAIGLQLTPHFPQV